MACAARLELPPAAAAPLRTSAAARTVMSSELPCVTITNCSTDTSGGCAVICSRDARCAGDDRRTTPSASTAPARSRRPHLMRHGTQHGSWTPASSSSPSPSPSSPSDATLAPPPPAPPLPPPPAATRAGPWDVPAPPSREPVPPVVATADTPSSSADARRRAVCRAENLLRSATAADRLMPLQAHAYRSARHDPRPNSGAAAGGFTNVMACSSMCV